MANQKSNSGEGNGFKTVAFGFDKNDVTMYIASLRKKMKALEESYEQKIQELGKLEKASETPQPSTQQQEKEASVAEEYYKEKIKGMKEENTQLSSQVERLAAEMTKLKQQLDEKDNANRLLKEQLAAFSQSGKENDAFHQNTARNLAEAIECSNSIIQFSSRLNQIFAIQKAMLSDKGFEGEIPEEISAPAPSLPVQPEENETPETADFNDLLENTQPEPAETAKQPAAAPPARNRKEELASMVSSISDSSNEGVTVSPIAEPSNTIEPDNADISDREKNAILDDFINPESDIQLSEEPTAKQIETEIIPEISKETAKKAKPNLDFDIADFGDLLADDEEVKVAPVSSPSMNFDVSEFGDLLADDEPEEDIKISELENSNEKGEDLGDDLYEMLIDPEVELKKADLGQMLSEQERRDKEFASHIEIKPAEIDEDMAALIAAAEDSVMPDLTDEEKEEAKNRVRPITEDTEDVFRFAFSDDSEDEKEENDDDDMSTDNFGFSGMI